jgi:hypothetical protein
VGVQPARVRQSLIVRVPSWRQVMSCLASPQLAREAMPQGLVHSEGVVAAMALELNIRPLTAARV